MRVNMEDEFFMYENRTMKAVEIVLRRGKEMRENGRGVSLIKIYCEHMYKRHDGSPLYANRNELPYTSQHRLLEAGKHRP
jgi:hypothetical protein